MKTNTIVTIVMVSIALSVCGLVSAADALTGKAIAEKARTATLLDGSEGVSTLTIYNAKGDKRVRTIAQVSKLYDNGDTEKRLVRFIAPADVKGTGLLTYDYETKTDDMWFFMPALRKTRRIVSSEKSKNFMGSEFTYSDMAPPAIDDFNYKVLKSEKIGGVECHVVESTPKTEDIADENGYSKRIAYFGKSDFVIRKAVYYDLDGELLKEMEVKAVKEIDPAKHRFRPMHMVMVNKQNGRKSVMKIDKIQLRADVPDEYFTTRYLERQ